MLDGYLSDVSIVHDTEFNVSKGNMVVQPSRTSCLFQQIALVNGETGPWTATMTRSKLQKSNIYLMVSSKDVFETNSLKLWKVLGKYDFITPDFTEWNNIIDKRECGRCVARIKRLAKLTFPDYEPPSSKQSTIMEIHEARRLVHNGGHYQLHFRLFFSLKLVHCCTSYVVNYYYSYILTYYAQP